MNTNLHIFFSSRRRSLERSDHYRCEEEEEERERRASSHRCWHRRRRYRIERLFERTGMERYLLILNNIQIHTNTNIQNKDKRDE